MDHNDHHEILVPGVTIWRASKPPSISDFPSRVTSIDHETHDDVSYNGPPSFSDFPSWPHSDSYCELICGQLGLGPDDFAIPAADYEAFRASYSARVSYSSPVLVTNDPLENDVETRRLYSIRELPETDEIVIKNWQKGEIIGRGSLGTVYEGANELGFFFAVKEVSLLDQGSQGKQSISQLEQEISLLSQFHHKNIVRYLGTDTDDGKLYIFLELVTKGSMANLYQKFELRECQVSAYTRQILSGLNYLHEHKVVHRNIKCANILVHANGSVKLTDFGLAKATTLNDIKSCKGTSYWMAPEVVNNQANKDYGLAADIWSLGCTMLEMLTRKIPYYHLEGMQALFRIGRGEPPEIPNTLSTEAQDFILKCLQVNPNDRPTAAQLLDHPFVKRPADTMGEILGTGSLGSVYEAVTENGYFFTVKEISLFDQDSERARTILQLEQKIFLLRQFHHENLVRYLGTQADESKLYILRELVIRGSLAKLYQMHELQNSQVSEYTRQILNGLNYLHERKVVHRDIKCANILIDANGSAKLADFGLANATSLIYTRSFTITGSPYWMAPEVINYRENKGYGISADIWSLGCTVLEMLTRRIPYSQFEVMQALYSIGKGRLPEIPSTLSAEARNFILKCLQVNPNDRPTAAELLEHPFVKGSTSMHLGIASPNQSDNVSPET